MSTIDKKAEELKEMQADLASIELNVLGNYTLADAIREGSLVSQHNQCGWGDGESACAMTAAVIAARARKYL